MRRRYCGLQASSNRCGRGRTSGRRFALKKATGTRLGSGLAANPGGCVLNESDPTDHALAAIASILDKPESLSFPDAPTAPEKPDAVEASAPMRPIEAEGY